MKMTDLPNPPVAGARAATVKRWRGSSLSEGTDWVAEEIPVALVYNGVSHAVMLATPADLEDFAVGFSCTEGLVDEPGQIYDIEVQDDAHGIAVHLDIASSCFMRLKERRRTLAGRTGCGLCGTDSLDQAVRCPMPLGRAQSFKAEAVLDAHAQMRERQALCGATGATHAAAWCRADGRIVLMREDVGRHNALDKLIGALKRTGGEGSGLKADEGFVAVTSRASYEMVQKTASAGVSLLAAVSGVTALAIETANAAGVSLLGFTRGGDFSIYSHPDRVIF